MNVEVQRMVAENKEKALDHLRDLMRKIESDEFFPVDWNATSVTTMKSWEIKYEFTIQKELD